MMYRLPPAGNRIAWSDRVDENAVRGLFAPWDAQFFGSGTEAFAALLATLHAHAPARDEVILAAYNCPEMISAIRYVGCRARLVDLAPGRPWMDLEAVARALSPTTLAVVAVDLFGIPERHAALREVVSGSGAALVQDSAQGFPKRAGDAVWQGDAVILSFGRGKPVSLLGGGAVLCRDRAVARDLGQVALAPARDAEPHHRRRVRAYNLLRHPHLYWVPAVVPALHLGETRFEPLQALTPMASWLKCRVPPAVAAYRERGDGVQTRYAATTFGHGVIDLARACGAARASLSRYPLLAPTQAVRDRLCAQLSNHGASPFYGCVLPEVAGLRDHFPPDHEFPRAHDIATRLFTLPTHDGVGARDLAAIGRLLGGAQPTAVKTVGESLG